MMKNIFEPFRIKMVEPIKMTTRSQREVYLKEAKNNIFLIKAENVIVDLLTDSGTGAMSAAQWGSMMEGDESYAGCRSFYDFEKTVKELTGFKYIFPTHQGRAAEKILFSVVGGEGKTIPNNTHFDTTRANIEFTKAKAVDLVIQEGKIPESEHPFKGNMDLGRLEALFIEEQGNVPLCMITITNNSGGGQPVSMKNIRDTKDLCDSYGIPLFLDACRFAENAYFIKIREEGYSNTKVIDIVHEMFSYADGCTMSAKKDGMVNMGGFLAFNDDTLADPVRNLGILTEGYPTYGGLAGRDLSAISVGLKEVVQLDYLEYRIESTKYLGESLIQAGIPVLRPIGGHAVYIDAKAMLPHIPIHEFPAQSLVCSLYLEGGIRGVEIGSVMFGGIDPSTGKERFSEMELLRLAIPRRVYTKSHMDYVIEVLTKINENKDDLRGVCITKEPEFLRHFTAEMKLL
jgi:tryptophanase